MKLEHAISLGLFGTAIYLFNKRRRESTNGIGATKRRIYKELSLAQQAGVDFTKKYDELSEDEIESLQRISNETGYTETYYKSLKKAYDAISGIGETYDVVDVDGNTILTWSDDPQNTPATFQPQDDAERYRALREAHEIEDDRQWAAAEKVREMEEREARLAETRRRLRKNGGTAQMALFGIGYAGTPDYSLGLLNRYLNTNQITDAQVVLNEKNKYGHYYVLCGDMQGGRDFYLSPKNLPYFIAYCARKGIECERIYWIEGTSGYAPNVESELYEIWIEQLNDGSTDYDYDTWRSIYGDEYAKSDVLPYMNF